MLIQNGYQGSQANVPSIGDYNALLRAMPNIEDAIPGAINCWTTNQKEASIVGGKVITLKDRMTSHPVESASQGVDGPSYSYSQRLGTTVCNFGNVAGHNKMLNVPGGTVLPQPFTIGAVFEQNVALTNADSCRIIGNAFGSDRLTEIFTDVPNRQWGVYNGGSATVCPYYDWSYVGPIALLCSFGYGGGIANNSRIIVIRGDGRVWHSEKMNILSDVGSGKLSWGGFATAATQGYPGAFADVFRMGRAFSQQDVASFIQYITTRYSGFSAPRNQILLDGDSLAATTNVWTSAIYDSLPRAHSLYCMAEAGRRIDEITDNLRLAFSEGVPGNRPTNLVYAATGGTNDVIQGKTYGEMMNATQDRIRRAKELGANTIIVSSVMPMKGLSVAQEYARTKFNYDLLSTWQMRGITKVVNVSTTEMIDGQQCPTQLLNPENLAFFKPDGIHPNAAGYVYFSNQFAQRINETI